MQRLCANVGSSASASARRDGRWTAKHAPAPALAVVLSDTRQAGPLAPATRRRPGCSRRIGTASPSLHRVGDPRVLCAPAEQHRLAIRHEHGSGTASGPIGRCPPGQPVAAWPSPGARRTQKADIGADLRALLARPGADHCPWESGRPREHPSGRTAATRSSSLGLRIRRSWIQLIVAENHQNCSRCRRSPATWRCRKLLLTWSCTATN